MYSLLQTEIQKTKTINENSNSDYDLIDKSWRFFVHCLNTIRSQQKILTTKAINYLLNLLNHKTNHDFIYIPWYNLLAWVNEQEKKSKC
jgi:hypothetical protein